MAEMNVVAKCEVTRAEHHWAEVLPRAPEKPYTACVLCGHRKP